MARKSIEHVSGMPGDEESMLGACPFCKVRYNTKNAEILESSRENHLLHVECSRCKSAVISFVFQGPSGLSSMGFTTDLTKADIFHFKKLKKLDLNEVIDLHFILKGIRTGQKLKERVG